MTNILKRSISVAFHISKSFPSTLRNTSTSVIIFQKVPMFFKGVGYNKEPISKPVSISHKSRFRTIFKIGDSTDLLIFENSQLIFEFWDQLKENIVNLCSTQPILGKVGNMGI